MEEVMDRQNLTEIRNFIRNELEKCTEFWLKNGIDSEYGGVYTCLDREGKIFSTDKSVWMQGRCAYIFASLCNTYGIKEEWLTASKSCLDFLENHCINHGAGDRLYFTVTGEGLPLRQRRYFFSEAFYSIANAEYYKATGKKEHLLRARRAYDLYWDLTHGMPDPTGLPPKTEPDTRRGHSLANPMIMLNMTSVLKRADPEREALYNERADECVREIVNLHFKPELGCTLENVDTDGTARLYYTEGRTVNPGHDIECSWFLMERANETGDKKLFETAVQMFDLAFDAGWDEEFGGILYFIDCMGFPPEAYEHDMKLWWPHNEALIASLMIYRDTKNEKYLDIFCRVLDYCKTYFVDPPFGEWYGYLRRDGKPTEPSCKGSTFKGPFHVPRCLSMVDTMLGEILNN